MGRTIDKVSLAILVTLFLTVSLTVMLDLRLEDFYSVSERPVEKAILALCLGLSISFCHRLCRLMKKDS